MYRKQIAIALSAVALSVSAVAANAATTAPFYNNGDENDLSWLPGKREVSAQPTAVDTAKPN